jgi:hypothetical protein
MRISCDRACRWDMGTDRNFPAFCNGDGQVAAERRDRETTPMIAPQTVSGSRYLQAMHCFQNEIEVCVKAGNSAPMGAWSAGVQWEKAESIAGEDVGACGTAALPAKHFILNTHPLPAL